MSSPFALIPNRFLKHLTVPIVSWVLLFLVCSCATQPIPKTISIAKREPFTIKIQTAETVSILEQQLPRLRPASTLASDITVSRFTLPDGKVLQVFTVDFSKSKDLLQSLNRLNRIAQKQKQTALSLVTGVMNLSSEEESKSHTLERVLSTYWLASPLLLNQSHWGPGDVILLSKDFFDGRQGWRIRSENGYAILFPTGRTP